MNAKRILAAIAAVVLCMTGVMAQVPGRQDRPGMTAVAEGTVKDQLKYQIILDSDDRNKVVIAGYEGEPPAELVIPAEIDGLPVVDIRMDAFLNCTALTSVTIPDSVTSIGLRAFSGCTALTSVTIPDSVTVIWREAFYGCTSLTSVTVPDSVLGNGNGSIKAFEGTPWLAALREKEPLIIINGILVDGIAAEGDIVIPDGVTEIADSAFDYCTSYEDEKVENKFPTSITIPKSVTRIGARAVNVTSALTSVTILNPDCEIADSRFTFINDIEILTDAFGRTMLSSNSCFTGTIYGYPGSTAEAYAKKYDRNFVALEGTPAVPDAPILGDPSGDSEINASDAAIVLMAAATEGTTGTSPLTAAQIKAADVNQDKTVNASDAAIILMYSAACGTGFTGDISAFQNK